MGQRAYNALFTADAVNPLTARDGKPYLRARGIIAHRDGPRVRTVLVRGPGYEAVSAHLRVGEPLALRGFYRRVSTATGRGGEFFSAFGLTSAKRGPGIPSSGARKPSEESDPRPAFPQEAVRGAADARRVATRRVSNPRPSTDEDSVEEGLPLLEPLVQIDEAMRPPAPSVEEMEAASHREPPRPTTMLIDGVETDLSDGWDGAAPRTVGGHDRQGHWRRQRHGPRSSLVKVIWIDASRVKGGSRRRIADCGQLDL